MLARDLIAQVIRTFYEELDDVRDGGKLGDMEQRYGDLYMTYFQKDRKFFLRSNMEEIRAFFSEDPDAVYKYEMLAELMYREAGGVSDENLRQVMYSRIIELYEVLDLLSMDFSFVRMSRVQELKNELKK